MLGTWHFGLIFGRKFIGSGAGHKPTMATKSCGRTHWFIYGLLRHFMEKVRGALLNPPPPPPMHLPYTFTGMKSCATCMMCLAQFLISPYLHYIQAFNMGGAGWRIGGPKTASSSLRIGFTADDLLLEISVKTLEEQDALRRQYELQQGHRAIVTPFWALGLGHRPLMTDSQMEDPKFIEPLFLEGHAHQNSQLVLIGINKNTTLTFPPPPAVDGKTSPIYRLMLRVIEESATNPYIQLPNCRFCPKP